MKICVRLLKCEIEKSAVVKEQKVTRVRKKNYL